MTLSNAAWVYRRFRIVASCATALIASVALIGCAPPAPNGDDFLNTTDPTNNGARFVGSGACAPCHPDIARSHELHGHSHILNQVFGTAPVYPPQATRANVPDPPEGFEWEDISYVTGGYLRKANFFDSEGFLLTDGSAGVDTLWVLQFPATQTQPHFEAFLPGQTERLPYTFDCFRCHTTGPSTEGSVARLPGIQGSWFQAGVQCEACHGPGSRHIAGPPRGIYVNPGAAQCGQCHGRDGGTIQAAGGFILHEQQYNELLASPHANIRCATCHNVHVSPNYATENVLINDCQDCHSDYNMALHAGKTYVQGDYSEVLTCHSCHMSYATRSASSALVGNGRLGDMRTHIFRINSQPVDFTTMFTDDGRQVRLNADGQAAVTLDYVCLRCHHDQGNTFPLDLRFASDIAEDIHEIEP